MAAQASQRLIKKYPNRRLYDTATSSYITLTDVKQLVIAAHPFVVVDAKSGDDLTRSILLQIILEEEAGGMPMLSSAMLAQMIRFYGHAMQGMMGAYLEKNMQFFVEMQERLAGQMPSAGTTDAWSQMLRGQPPAMQTLMTSYMDQSRQMIEQMQAQSQRLFGGFAPGFGFGSASAPADATASPGHQPQADEAPDPDAPADDADEAAEAVEAAEADVVPPDAVGEGDGGRARGDAPDPVEPAAGTAPGDPNRRVQGEQQSEPAKSKSESGGRTAGNARAGRNGKG
ncbi:polyhydroxyalkanoate synthesis repressor PhaR [Chitinasiproducens palmae]|uniref:Polyhydroxyalkanoate synthesis repressor PhaR n=1 Tax=Chitinasiproducens palmae TaxID=1770053 RepID=A0A1H2PVM6_9BURK|nr:polyhydroxyalkanoate synthesis repressor PhaR [Chitinasiproducens palmae]